MFLALRCRFTSSWCPLKPRIQGDYQDVTISVVRPQSAGTRSSVEEVEVVSDETEEPASKPKDHS